MIILRYTYDRIYNNLKITTLPSYNNNSKQKCELASRAEITLLHVVCEKKHFILVFIVFD